MSGSGRRGCGASSGGRVADGASAAEIRRGSPAGGSRGGRLGFGLMLEAGEPSGVAISLALHQIIMVL